MTYLSRFGWYGTLAFSFIASYEREERGESASLLLYRNLYPLAVIPLVLAVGKFYGRYHQNRIRQQQLPEEEKQTSLLQQPESVAIQQQMMRLLVEKDRLLAEINANVEVFETLLSPWFDAPDKWQAILSFIQEKVFLGKPPVENDIAKTLGQLTADQFPKLPFDKKLEALLWLYRQLNTIAQLTLDPYNRISASGDRKNAKFYRPFAKLIDAKIKDAKGDNEAQRFRTQASLFITNVLLSAANICDTGNLRKVFSPENIINFLKIWIQKGNNKKNELSAHWEDRMATIKTALAPQQELVRRSLLFIEIELSFTNMLPIQMIKFWDILADASVASWINCPLNFSKKTKRQYSRTGVEQALPSEQDVRRQQRDIILENIGKHLENARMLFNNAQSISVEQINVGLFFCSIKIVLILREEFPRQAVLKKLRSLLAHFSFTLALNDPKTIDQFFKLSCLLVETAHADFQDESAVSKLQNQAIYQILLDRCNAKPEENLITESELQQLEAVAARTQMISTSSSNNPLSKIVIAQGLLILCGQAGRDLDLAGMSSDFYNFLTACIPYRHVLMHEPHITFSAENIDPILLLSPRQNHRSMSGV